MTAHTTQSGYIALITILIIGAVASAVTVTLILYGLNASRMSSSFENSAAAAVLAHACAEEGLQEIRDNTSYTGSDTLSLGNGDCEYAVVSTGGEGRTVTASSTVGTMVRKVEVSISAINPQIVVDSWQEVSDF